MTNAPASLLWRRLFDSRRARSFTAKTTTPMRSSTSSLGQWSAYKTADGSEHIVAFLLPDDLFGLAAEGLYANSTKAITAVSARIVFRLPRYAAALRRTPSWNFTLYASFARNCGKPNDTLFC